MKKTKKSIKKRFKVKKTGKVIYYRSPGHRHLLRKKNRKNKRYLKMSKKVNSKIASKIRISIL
jgi:ribosomal protein L35